MSSLFKRLKFFDHDFQGLVGRRKHRKRNNIRNNQDRDWNRFPAFLMEENYMNDLSVLNTQEFIVCIKPKATRCLIITQNSYTAVISESGKLLLKTVSLLPNHELDEPNTVIECYLIDNTLAYVQDVIIWDTEDCTQKTAKERFFLIKNKLIRDSSILNMVQVEFYLCNYDSISYCYHSDQPYLKDGMLFYNSDGIYEQGLTYNKLKWTDSHVGVLAPLVATLECRGANLLTTRDGHSVYKLKQAHIDAFQPFTGKTLDCQILSIENFQAKDLVILGSTNSKPTSWSRILFEYNLLNDQIHFQDMLEAIDKTEATPKTGDFEQEDITEFIF
jgi:hypothetical protein